MSFAFFRKYNKIILAVGGSLLMVIFLIPQAASSLIGKPTSRVVGHVGDREITIGDLQTANAEMQVLAALGDPLRSILPSGNSASLNWLLMVQEARNQGLYGSTARGHQLLDALGVDAPRLADVKQQFGCDDAFIYQCLRHFQMVQRLAGLTVAARRVSEPAMRHFARDIQTTVSVDVVPVHADRLLDDIPEPTEAELLDRFNQNRNDLPGRSQPYGFGYRLMPRVKLEYITVPRERVRAGINVDEVEARRYYIDHPQEFLPTDDQGNPLSDAEPKPYRDVREQIRTRLTDQQTSEKLTQITKTILAELAETTRRYERDGETGYLKVGKLADFQTIAEQIQRDYGLLPDVDRIENHWIPLDEIDQVDGFGKAYLLIGAGAQRQPVSAAQYISTVRELTPPERNPLASLKLQVGVPGQPLRDDEGNAYIFRILDAQPSQPPASLDEVRDQVARDVRLLKAYGRLQQTADDYLAIARDKGMPALAESLGDDAAVQSINDFSRRDFNPQISTDPIVPVLPVVGRSAAFVDGVFDLLGPVIRAGALEATPQDQRIGAVPVDAKLSVYITEVTAYQPLHSEQFADMRMFYGQFIEQEDQVYARRQGFVPFDTDALATRVGYTPVAEKEPREDEQEQPADQ